MNLAMCSGGIYPQKIHKRQSNGQALKMEFGQGKQKRNSLLGLSVTLQTATLRQPGCVVSLNSSSNGSERSTEP